MNNDLNNTQKESILKPILIGIAISITLYILFWVGKFLFFPQKINTNYVCRVMGEEYYYNIEYIEKNNKITKIEADDKIKEKVDIKEKINANEMIEKINKTFKEIGGICQEKSE